MAARLPILEPDSGRCQSSHISSLEGHDHSIDRNDQIASKANAQFRTIDDLKNGPRLNEVET
ncbi:MAG: hypothetical protein CTY39_07875 [Hyphomicrobium sp.]|nr:MAG: hypothetical protein CTY39_07875 [Hyphomicrobium sp.]